MKTSLPFLCALCMRSTLVAVLSGVAALAQAAPGDTELVSVGMSGNAAGGSGGAVSGDGRYVAFVSSATDMVPNDTNAQADTFLFDRQTGLIEQISVSSSGQQAMGPDGSEGLPAITPDGRYVAFASWATNLVPGDTNGYLDAFLRDRVTGVTERVSVDSNEVQTPQYDTSYEVSISADGRYVVFNSSAALVPADTNHMSDTYVRDRALGTTQRVSVTSSGTQAVNRGSAWGSLGPTAISAGGRYVAFASSATDLVPGDSNDHLDVFVHDRQTGLTQRVSVNSNGTETALDSTNCSISADGRYVAFVYGTQFTSLQRFGDVLVRDRQAGTTELIAHNAWAWGNPVVSSDGRYLAFDSEMGLVADDTNEGLDAYLYDRQTGEMQRVSVGSNGEQADQDTLFGTGPALSGDGRFVTFSTHAQFAANDQNNIGDVYAHEIGSPVVAPFTLSPTAVGFGKQAWGATSAARTIKLTNTSSTSLPISAIELAGQNYLQFGVTSHCGASLAVGASCQIDVVFKPTSVGVKTASLNVQTGAGSKSATLTGEGVSTSFTLSATSINFGSQAVGTVSPRHYITLTNLSEAPLPIRAIAIGGTNPGQFGFNRTCGSSVPIAGSCTIGVVFKPTSVGTKTAVITVKVAGGAKDKTVSLSGQGN